MNHKTFTIIGSVLATVLFIISCISTAAEQQNVSHVSHNPHNAWYEIKESSMKKPDTSSLCYLANSPTKCYRCVSSSPAATVTGLPLKVTIFKPFSIGLKPIALSRG